MSTPSIIVFDLNETLLDIESMARPCSRGFSGIEKFFASGLTSWFCIPIPSL
jgi:hypothetical protein